MAASMCADRRFAEDGAANPIAPRALLREIERVLCPSPLPPTEDAQPVWQRRLYDEWAARLGEEKMLGFLGALRDQLQDLKRLAHEGPAEALHRLAHDVASTAGMLGFLKVTRRCRAVLETEGEVRALAALGPALEAAIACIDRHFAIRLRRARAA